jgi:oxygen-dependent protoporphyrinogen oxidase
VAIVGGGIAGLSAAWELVRRSEAAGSVDVTVFEPDRLGGCIRTSEFAGHLVDEGPDAFLTRVPDAVQLCQELGIGDELVAPAAGRSMLWWNGRLRPLPEGLVLGVPRQLRPLITSGILSPPGVARAALDLLLPRGRPPATLTVRELVAARFGPEVADRLVDPLVGGIHAGSTRDLSALEVVPQLVAAAERSRSLLLALRTTQSAGGLASAGPDQPVFLTPRAGVGRLVDVLVDALASAGTRFVPHAATEVRDSPGGGLVVAPETDPFDAAVVATRARTAAALLGTATDGLTLAGVPTASVAVVTAALAGARFPPGVNGFLVPAGGDRLMTACSFASSKWPHWADPGQGVVRMSVGRYGDGRALDLDDATLTDRLLAELEEALGSDLSPTASRVSRWPDAFPQYLVGHGDRINQVESDLAARLPTVALAGASYRGSGIPACIASGRRAARLVLERVGSQVV